MKVIVAAGAAFAAFILAVALAASLAGISSTVVAAYLGQTPEAARAAFDVVFDRTTKLAGDVFAVGIGWLACEGYRTWKA